MRSPEFTPEAIIEAGLELQAAGRNVNGFSIRKKIGGGNAPRLMQVWLEHSIQTEGKAEVVSELPAEVAEKVASVTQSLTERLSALAAEMNQTAVQTAERRVSEVLRSAGEQRDQAERELFDAAEAVDDLEAQLDAAKVNTDELETRLSETQSAAQALAVELAQVRERLSLAEKSAGQAQQEHTDELARLHAGSADARTRRQAELDEAKKAIKIVEGERDQVRGELATVVARAAAAAETLQEQKKGAAAEVHRNAERLTKAQTERDQARAEAGTAREESARLAGLVEGLQGQVKDLMSALAKPPINQKVKP